MAEREQKHRHSTLDSVVEYEFTFRKRGQWFMLAALTLLIAAVALLAWLGDTKSAALLGGATIVAVVSVIVTGRLFDTRDDENERQPKVEEEPKPAAKRQLPQPKGKRRK
jgi:uncharacterized membrane protein